MEKLPEIKKKIQKNSRFLLSEELGSPRSALFGRVFFLCRIAWIFTDHNSSGIFRLIVQIPVLIKSVIGIKNSAFSIHFLTPKIILKFTFLIVTYFISFSKIVISKSDFNV